MNRTALVAVSAAAVAVIAVPALAAPPKPVTQKFSYTDATADPTATAGTLAGCDGLLPNEAPVEFTAPGAGKLKVSITTTGDWALEVHDPKGRLLGSSDGGVPTDQESVSIKIKAAGTYTVLPCNLGGLPTATGVIDYKP
jgi:hypothetical protein